MQTYTPHEIQILRGLQGYHLGLAYTYVARHIAGHLRECFVQRSMPLLHTKYKPNIYTNPTFVNGLISGGSSRGPMILQDDVPVYKQLSAGKETEAKHLRENSICFQRRSRRACSSSAILIDL